MATKSKFTIFKNIFGLLQLKIPRLPLKYMFEIIVRDGVYNNKKNKSFQNLSIAFNSSKKYLQHKLV